jgi:hypothetical protein
MGVATGHDLETVDKQEIIMKKKGSSAVIPTAIIIGTAASLMAGWSWHSLPGYELVSGNHVVEKAFYEKQSELMVEVTGQVVRVIDNDDTFDSVQWFHIRTPGGHHLLISHDIGRGEPIPLSIPDSVTVRGRYDWSESGGTIRNTERDSSMDRLHGWVEHKGEKYQ